MTPEELDWTEKRLANAKAQLQGILADSIKQADTDAIARALGECVTRIVEAQSRIHGLREAREHVSEMREPPGASGQLDALPPEILRSEFVGQDRPEKSSYPHSIYCTCFACRGNPIW